MTEELSIDEKRDLAASVRRACDRMSTLGRARTIALATGARPGFDGDLWRVLCKQVGITAVSLPPEFGGAGYGSDALSVVARELGRQLAPVPFLASAVLASGLLADLGADSDTMEALMSGKRTAAVALTGNGSAWDRSAVTLTARLDHHGWVIHGTARHVLHGGDADDLVAIAITAKGELAVLTLDRSATGVHVRPERVLDGTRPMATITFAGARADHVHVGTDVEEIGALHADRALALLSVEQVGSCEKLLEITTEYARAREQFGQPIGSFQAIKHKCADMLVSLEWARSASQAAVEAADAGSLDAAELPWRASMAKAVCSEALRDAARTAVQVHGGIGFTWESLVHLFLRRARTDEVIFGGPAHHWDRLTAEAGLAQPKSISLKNKTSESTSQKPRTTVAADSELVS